MDHVRTLGRSLLLALSILFLVAGAKSVQAATTPEPVTVTPAKLNLGVGEKYRLVAGPGLITFSSSNTKVASVSKTGVVKAKKPGKATITAQRSTVSATCKVKVVEEYKALYSRYLAGYRKGSSYYHMIDIDNAGIPELVLAYPVADSKDVMYEVYTVRDHKVATMGYFSGRNRSADVPQCVYSPKYLGLVVTGYDSLHEKSSRSMYCVKGSKIKLKRYLAIYTDPETLLDVCEIKPKPVKVTEEELSDYQVKYFRKTVSYPMTLNNKTNRKKTFGIN